MFHESNNQKRSWILNKQAYMMHKSYFGAHKFSNMASVKLT